MQWNVSSMKKETFHEIRRIRPHLICFQEIRGKELSNTPAYNFVNLNRKTSANVDGKYEGG